MIVYLTILTIISIYILNLGLIKGKDNVELIGTITLIITIIFGWLFLGILLNIHKTEYKTSIICEQHKNEFVVKDSLGNIYSFDKKIDFDYITDTTTFYIIISDNIYGFNTDYDIYYNVLNRKIKGSKK